MGGRTGGLLGAAVGGGAGAALGGNMSRSSYERDHGDRAIATASIVTIATGTDRRPRGTVREPRTGA
ncbi:hypothetical protein CSX04_05394 [Burkholderia cepacia]|nr:hypothetical protein CSX04_05394 [Burkholderia cepacia]